MVVRFHTADVVFSSPESLTQVLVLRFDMKGEGFLLNTRELVSHILVLRFGKASTVARWLR